MKEKNYNLLYIMVKYCDHYKRYCKECDYDKYLSHIIQNRIYRGIIKVDAMEGNVYEKFLVMKKIKDDVKEKYNYNIIWY